MQPSDRNPLQDPTKSQPEDHVNRAMKAIVSLVVPAGVLEYFNWIVGDPAQERRDDFMKALYDELKKLESSQTDFSPDRLRENTAFQATVIQAIQIASRTAQEEKLKMLRAAILNSALWHDLDDNIRQIFLHYIERFTALHVKLLNFLDNPRANPEVSRRLETLMAGGLDQVVDIGIPSLRGQHAFTKLLAADLQAANLLSQGGFNTTMTAQGLGERRTTDLGRAFISFITLPVTR